MTTLTQDMAGTIFEALSLFKAFKEIYPEVILNYYHREPLKNPSTEDLAEKVEAFKTAPTKENFTALFDLMKYVDSTFEGQKSVETVFNAGLLSIGKSTWQAFSLVPGEYPFANLRLLQMNKEDVEKYQQTPKIDFKLGDNNTLKIAACVLAADTVTQFGGKPNLKGKEYGLTATSMSNPDKLAADLRSSLEWAKENNANVVMFPELSIDNPGLEVIENWIKENGENLENIPQIIVAGSFYHEVEGKLRNRSPIFLIDPSADSPEPFYLTHYDKSVPFSVTVPKPGKKEANASFQQVIDAARAAGANIIVEDFESSGSITVVNTSVGYFCFAICRDVLDLAGIGNPLKQYLDFADFITVISFNAGVTELFEAQGEDFARWHNCGVTYVNAKQALADYGTNTTVKMSFNIYPYDKAGSALSGEIYYAKAEIDSFGEMKVKSVPDDGNILYEMSIEGL